MSKLTTNDLIELTGSRLTTLNDWIGQAEIVPLVTNVNGGRGKSREFSTMQAVALLHAAQLREAGLSGFIDMSAGYIANRLTEAELESHLARGESSGIPVLNSWIDPRKYEPVSDRQRELWAILNLETCYLRVLNRQRQRAETNGEARAV